MLKQTRDTRGKGPLIQVTATRRGRTAKRLANTEPKAMVNSNARGA